MLAKALSVALLLAQPAAVDPEIAKGIKTVEEGDYDAAIVVLDQAVRRLAKDPSRARDLSQGYLYLGIAYVGKGHEAAARAKFREALGQAGDLSLSADKFPPKVIDIFEAARTEARQDAAKSGASEPKKKGGGGKGILIGAGVAAAAGVGVAVAGGGGGSSGSSPSSSSTPSSGAGTSASEVFQGLLTLRNTAATIPLPATTATGSWRAELSWTGTRTEVRMFIVDAVTRAGVAEVRLVTPNSSLGEWQGTGRRYEAELFLQEGGGAESNYTLRVSYPR